MRQAFLILSIVAIATSCKKDTSSTTDNNGNPQAPVITSSAMADFKAGSTVNFFQVDLAASPITVPTPGANQTWNYSNLAVKNQSGTAFETVMPNPAFGTATYMRTLTDTFGTGASAVTVSSKNYYEITTGGWAFLGRSIPQLALSYPALGGSLTFPAQSVVATPKNYEVPFPLHYGDSSNISSSTQTYNFVINAPLLGLSNTPGTQVTTSSYRTNAIAWGNLQLKGYSNPLPVLVVKKVSTSTSNYFLGGVPAPAALLTLAGLSNGQTVTTTYYDYFSATAGYMGEVTVNSAGTAVTEATFRKNF